MNSIKELTKEQADIAVALLGDNISVGNGTTDCWEWMLAENPQGYGYAGIDTIEGRVSVSTHRLAYILLEEDIPDKMILRHKCDNPICCNPNHLMVGTPRQNTQDKIIRRGTQVMERLSTEVKEDLRYRREQGRSYKELAIEFGLRVTWVRDWFNS